MTRGTYGLRRRLKDNELPVLSGTTAPARSDRVSRPMLVGRHARRRPNHARSVGSALLLSTALAATGWSCGPPGAEPAGAISSPPYLPSSVLSGISFDWETHRRLAPGSDNWPMTWAADGSQYTSWGDGGGFGGTNADDRVSLGVARVDGGPDGDGMVNVWGGAGNSESAADVEGKSYGILALRDSIYLWISPGSDTQNWSSARLYRSGDGGRSWEPTSVILSGEADSLGVPAFIQHGRDHEWSRDGYVYVYATGITDIGQWEVQRPGRIFLLRVREDSISSPGAYRHFAGLDPDGEPTWNEDSQTRQPVFEDPNGVMRNSAVYVEPLDRYILVTSHTAKNEGNLGLFEAPDPWGPWGTVLYEDRWGSGHIPANAFYWNIAPAWIGEDGLEFVMVFTGKGANDSWNSVRGTFLRR